MKHSINIVRLFVSLHISLILNGGYISGFLAQELVCRAFPWHASIFVRQETSSISYVCGGSLVSRSFILTAAHCVVTHDPERISIQLVSHATNLIRIHVHPLYFGKAGNYGSDIALLELKTKVQFNEFIQPVMVNYWQREDVITTAMPLPSMGHISVKVDKHLEIITIPIVGYDDCLSGQRRDFWKFITFTSFCAGWSNGTRRGVCNGDSGSGLVVYCPRTGISWLKGVVSLSPRKPNSSLCDQTQFTLFTKVDIFGSWIQSLINAENRDF